MPDTLKIITSNSTLALKQAAKVLDLIPGLKYNLIVLPTSGSKPDAYLLSGNEPRYNDQAVLKGKADLLIISASDLHYPLSTGLEIIALIEGFDQNDSTLTNGDRDFKQIQPDTKQAPVPTTRRKGQFAIVALSNRPELKELFAKNDIRNQFGKITLVGFGPGNPDLLTLGGDKALSQSDIIFHDDLLDKDYLNKYTAEKVYVGKRKGSHCVEQNEINRLLLEAALAGKQVVRLKGGDPMIFAHGGEEIEFLERNLIEVEVIPGVSSGIAVASLLKVPLTHRGISSSIAFISGHSENTHLPDADTLIIYMGGTNIRAIARKAIEQGRDPGLPVMLVYNLSLPDQQEFFFTLKELTVNEQKFPTPVIIVMGEVVSFRNKPATEFLKNSIPKVENAWRFEELGKGLERLKSFEWLIFTNRETVNTFFGAFERHGKDSRFLAGIKIAVIGKNTVGALREHGIIPDLIPEAESSEGLLSRIKELGIAPSKALIPLSVPQLPFLQQGLNELGWEVNQLILYRNISLKNFSPLAFHPSAKPYSHRHREYPTFYDVTSTIE
ncbi:MAG TPA: uroporphyrinogen-III C-methyltransferase [Prolixibacteraceae bacterium]